MHHIPLAMVLVGVTACTSTYHPEYHPVTVTSVHQDYAGAPVTVSPSTGAGAASPVVVVPAQATQPLVVPEPALADPNVVFR